LGEHLGLAHVRAGRNGVTVRRALLLAMLALLAPSLARAHDVSYSYADLRWERTRVDLKLTLHRDDAAPALGLAAPESLMAAPFLSRKAQRLFRFVTARVHVRGEADDLSFRLEGAEAVPDQHAVRLTLSATLPHPVSRVSVIEALFPENPQHETFLNAYASDGRVLAQEVLTAKHSSAEVYAAGPEGVLAVLRTFVAAGVHHIYIGPDHILFIIGLLLLGGGIGRVLRVATAFTLAHSITLALAVLGLVRVPGRIVEPLIALSVVYVGFENLRVGTRAADWRTRIAFAFGLIHGFGFASVLREFGLPHAALAWSLLGFNLGVEIGQASIILVVVPLFGALRAGLPRLAARAVAIGSWGIVCTGGFWFVARLLTRG
jgi:hydrogenase/urease accessory protein HupE